MLVPRNAPLLLADVSAAYVKAGAGVAAFTALGADAVTTSDTGAGVAPFTGGGVNSTPHTYVKMGAGVSDFDGTADGRWVTAETGAGVLNNTVGAGADVPTQQNTGAGVSERKASGGKQLLVSRAGSGVSQFTASGAKVHELLRSCLADSDFTGGGAAAKQRTSSVVVDTLYGVYPVFTVTGPCVNPFLSNDRTGERVQAYVTLALGDVLVMDHRAQTLTLNGARVPGASGRFFGVESVQEVGAGASAIEPGFSVYMTAPTVTGQRARAFTGGGVSERVAVGGWEGTVSRSGTGSSDFDGGGRPGTWHGEGVAESELVGSGRRA